MNTKLAKRPVPQTWRQVMQHMQAVEDRLLDVLLCADLPTAAREALTTTWQEYVSPVLYADKRGSVRRTEQGAPPKVDGLTDREAADYKTLRWRGFSPAKAMSIAQRRRASQGELRAGAPPQPPPR